MKPLTNVAEKYDHFYRYQEITDLLKGYAARYPQLTRLDETAKTPEGRSQWLLEITDTGSGDFSDKPALYVEGNIHAGEVTGCMACMYLLDYLFTNLEDPDVKRILKEFTLYIMPRVSPDGSEHYLTTPDYVRSVDRPYPFTDTMPGLAPQDLDGDGVVRRMRVKSPFGIWKISDKDPRLMVRRQPDDMDGDFYNVYEEGLINDYDGLSVKSAPQKFGNDFNRNYPIGWQPEHQQHGAGSFPLSNPETRGNAEFLLSHPNVCAVLDMHTMGGQILYTPGFKSRKDAIKADIDLYKRLGHMMQQENHYPLVNVFDEYMPQGYPPTYGGFDDFTHFTLGLPAFTIECWDLDKRAGLPEEFPPKAELSDQEQENEYLAYLKWIDQKNDGQGYKPWTHFDHPQLGDVEIGGIDYKYVVQNPPVKFLEEVIEPQARAMMRLVKSLPRVRFADTKAEHLSGDFWRIETTVENLGFMASYVFKEGLALKTMKPVCISLTADKGELHFTDGKARTDIGQLEGFSGISGYNSTLGALSMEKDPHSRRLVWVVEGAEGTELTLTATGAHIGKTSQKVVLG